MTLFECPYQWNTSQLMLYYATSSNFPLPTRCSVDLYQTLKIADLENTYLENVVYILLKKPYGSSCCSWVNNFLCVFPSLCFSNTFMRAVGWANVADSDLILKSAGFRYWWEPAKQDNNFPCVFVNKIVTKMPQKDKNSILNVVSGGFCGFRVM